MKDSLATINPFTNEVLAQYEFTSKESLGQKLKQSTLAFKHWAYGYTVSERVVLFKQLGALLLQNRDVYALCITNEMGKTLAESRAEIDKCASLCHLIAEEGSQMAAPQSVKTNASKSEVHLRPLGTILSIMPWNFPFWQVFRALCGPLLLGNVVILKHALNTSGCGKMIVELFETAGFPAHVIQQVILDNARTQRLIGNPTIKGVTLTGSNVAGKAVALAAARNLKPSVLELGGSDPFIVLADADIEQSVEIAIESRLRNAGQSCIAPKRFIVERKVYGDFMEQLEFRLRTCKQGNPLSENVLFGPMARFDLVQKAVRQCAESMADGAHLVGALTYDGCNMDPGIIGDVKPTHKVFKEEVFAPIFAVSKASSEGRAFDLAQKSPFALGASIWTKEPERVNHLASQLPHGSVFFNDYVRSEIHLPFGGNGQSGWGRELGIWGMQSFANVQTWWEK